ncbi:MAG: dithiol-disulfide isomerase [Xanthomarina sp.]|uniref:DsbA family protein n=1 Tax=Xanthomarina sp. TaxID=1931211 RepID=UPI000C60FACA|nr:DsbA family protein [Xanthomarina sp.]MAL23013.1 dithiol-disulfide isomerase [Xanthomarina sp.]MBF62937.1 dithiol-disulfide isomerase [Xanthomarina sp.]HAB26891.1 dithiol-disulfide isomerase [Xanthomarina gelatinilytica]
MEHTSEKIRTDNTLAKPIRVMYYTDPICSSCWGIEPQLRKLKLEYGHLLDFEYRMGGLLPDWNYSDGIINNPVDVAKHWDEVSYYFQMPIDGDIWLEDPLHSSYPPSIAFKAAQLQDDEKAIDFLRQMRELLFLEKKNITKWEHIAKAAIFSKLDVNQLKEDYLYGKAEQDFLEDLELGRQLGIRGFPTIIFKDEKGNEQLVYGSKSYKDYELAINKLLPLNKKKHYDTSLNNLLSHYPTLTVKEYAELADKGIIIAKQMLDDLNRTGQLKRTETKNGNLYSL